MKGKANLVCLNSKVNIHIAQYVTPLLFKYSISEAKYTKGEANLVCLNSKVNIHIAQSVPSLLFKYSISEAKVKSFDFLCLYLSLLLHNSRIHYAHYSKTDRISLKI